MKEMKPVDGNAVNDTLHNFKLWFADFTIELSPLLVLIGMLMTGVDVLLNGRLATQLYFEIPWAVVQIIAIDGLWFAIWLRILSHEHKRAWLPWLRFLAMLTVALAMLTVAFIMNDIVLFQQVESMPSSLQAMAYLHIPVAYFTHFRALLLVATATIAMLFSHSHSLKRSTRSIPKATLKSTVTVTERSPEAIPEHIEHSPKVVNGSLETVALHSPEYIRLREVMATERSLKTYADIASVAQVSVAMVKKHAPKIRQELGL